MRQITFWLLWIVVFSIPLEQVTSIALVGSVTRMLGIAAAGSGVLACVVVGRIRRPAGLLIVAAVFAALAMLSLLWTLSSEASVPRGLTYLQLLGLVWLVWEFARTRDKFESLIAAYCFGAYVAVAILLVNFMVGVTYFSGGPELRYSAAGMDPNDMGLTLALGIPMAWYLYLIRRQKILTLAGFWYVPLAAVGILLTGSRGASLAALIALSVIPLTSLHRARYLIGSIVVVAVALAAAATVVPTYSFDRIVTLGASLQSRDFSGREQIWAAGYQVFLEHPVLGVGVGAFATAIYPLIGVRDSPHNAFLAILVEQGAVGFTCFAVLVAAWIGIVRRLPLQDRRVWSVVIATWALGSMSLNWEYRKNAWLLFGLAAVHAAIEEVRDRAAVRSITASPNRPATSEGVDFVQAAAARQVTGGVA